MRKKIPMFLCAMLCAAVVAGTAKADDFDIARNNKLKILVGPASFSTSDPAIATQISEIDSTANSWWSSMETGASRTELWSDLTFPSSNVTTRSAHITSTYTRLRDMALAYTTYGTTLNGNSSLLAAIIDGLTWMNTNQYNTGVTESGNGNWWDWEIGVPLKLNDTMVLLYPQLTSTQISTWAAAIQHFTPNPKYTGANLMWTAEIVSLTGVLTKNGTKVSAGVTSAPTVLNTVSSGDGFYADGSFIQHSSPGFAYTGGYGLSLIADLVDFTAVYTGTQWAIPAATVSKEVSCLFKSFQPFIYKGEMMDDVRGRDISRWSDPSHLDGRKTIRAFMNIIPSATATDAAKLSSTIKDWLQTDTTYTNHADGFDIGGILQAEDILNNSSITPMPEPTGFKLFSGMDRIVHLRPGWGVGLSMFSSRRGDYEAINAENKKGWHTGDGMLYVYDADLLQHSDNYWPTINNYQQEGTTVEANTSQTAGAASGTNFVGGAPSWDGVYGLGVMALAPPSRPLTGKKTWFFLDNQVMCLGADITSTGSAAVQTIISNRKLTSAGTNTVTSDTGSSSASPVTEPGTVYQAGAAQYLHIAGNVAGSSVGYFFPTPLATGRLREARTHAWSEINTSPNYVTYNTPYTNNYYTTTLNHGVAPTGASFAYAVLPNISLTALASYAATPEVTILENSASAQAISDTKLGATAGVFWQTSSHTVGTGSNSITSSTQSAVFVTNRSGNLEISVTDPTQVNTSGVNISLGSSALSLIDSSPQITVTQLSPNIEISVATSGLKGQPALARFNLSAAGLVVVDNATNTGGSTVSSTGTWTSSTGAAGYYGTDYVHDGNAGKGTKTFTFRPSLVNTGSYDVQINYTTNPNRATNVPVTINSADGAKTVTVDMTTGGAWVSLGVYNFNAGTSGTVVISNTGTNGYVVADAVRFIAR